LGSLQTFLNQYKIESFKKGNVVLGQDVEPTCAYVIKKGIIKTYNITSKGEEKPIGFNVAGDIIPLGWVFNKILKSVYFYEALTNCQLYVVPKNDLLTFVQSDLDVMSRVLDRVVWRGLIHTTHINALEQSKASDKVLYTVHFLALYFGTDVKTDVVEILIPITQQDIANFTGLTRETTSAELKKLADQKVLLVRRRNYVVFTDRLNALLDDEYERRLIR
jgi:CRP/FNR family transcriptional regulator